MKRLSDDGYARLPFEPGRFVYPTVHGGVLLFLDPNPGAEWSQVSSWFQAAPPALLASAPLILIRWNGNEDGSAVPAPDQEITAQLDRLCSDLRQRAILSRVGAVQFSIGAPPRIVWPTDTQSELPEAGAYLQRARLAELNAFLTWGRAISEPTSYHYVLPSGDHAQSFIRLAEALRGDPRAAGALATWLFHGVSPTASTSIVVDTGTVSPIITELQAAADSAGATILRVMTLDSYPVSSFEYRNLVRHAAGTHVLGIISVSSSGTLQSRFDRVLKETAPTYRLETIVARQGPPAQQVPNRPGEEVTGVQAPWVGLDDTFPVVNVNEASCPICQNPDRARLVRIDPSSLTAMALPAPVRVVPDLFDGRRNKDLWNHYNARFLLPEPPPGVAISHRGSTNTRDSHPRSVKNDRRLTFFEPGLLLMPREDFDPKSLVAERLRRMANLPHESPTDRLPKEVRRSLEAVHKTPPTIVVIDQAERALFDTEEEWPTVREALATAAGGEASTCVALHDSRQKANRLYTEDGTELPDGPAKVTIVALGVRSGVTLQRTFLDVRDRWANAEVAGVAIHAHPSDQEYWKGIRNTFVDDSGKSKLVALWLTHLPRRSPMDEEIQLLKSITDNEFPQEVQALAQARVRGENQFPLWGVPEREIRPTSFYGDRLRGDALLVAVGSAVHSRRVRARANSSPDWVMFDLPRVFRSYFDALIQASVIRWLLPSECWWGDMPGAAVDVLIEVEERSRQNEDWQLLLPELLLASAMDKVPFDGIEHLVERAEAAIEHDNLAPAVSEWHRLGRWLADRAISERLDDAS